LPLEKAYCLRAESAAGAMAPLLPDLARQKRDRALEREPAGLVVQVELIFVRQRRLRVRLM